MTFPSAPFLPGQLTVATYPNPVCHNNPTRDNTELQVQAGISKEGSEATSLPLMASPISLLHSPKTHRAHLSSLHLSRQTFPHTHIPTPTAQPHDSHGPLQFFILDGAVQGLGKEKQIRAVWVNPEGRYTMYPNARAQSPPSQPGGEDRTEGEGSRM